MEAPKTELEHIHYSCGNTELPDDLQAHEPQRVALYKATVALVRAFANIADELEAAGYLPADILAIREELKSALALREIIRKTSGESLDLKAYEADMRHLIDTYITADDPRKISPFDTMPLLELIASRGIDDALDTLPNGIKGNQHAVAETIENNVRRKIIKEHLNDPAFYEKMSDLLDEIIATRRAKAIEYEEYLLLIGQLTKRVQAGQAEDTPKDLNTPGKRALYNNLCRDMSLNGEYNPTSPDFANEIPVKDRALELARNIDRCVKGIRSDDWRGNTARENAIKTALYAVLKDRKAVDGIFPILVQQREY